MTVRVYYEVSKIIEVDDKYRELIRNANEKLEDALVEDVEFELPYNCGIKAVAAFVGKPCPYENLIWKE